MRRSARAFVRRWVALTAAWASGLAGARAGVTLVHDGRARAIVSLADWAASGTR